MTKEKIVAVAIIVMGLRYLNEKPAERAWSHQTGHFPRFLTTRYNFFHEEMVLRISQGLEMNEIS